MTDFSRLLSDYFEKYLSIQKGCSSNTLKTYRDAIVQLLIYMKDEKKKDINKLEISDFDFTIVNNYLDFLENDKNITAATRNNRLAAIKSFFKYAAYREPKYLMNINDILEIKKKKSISKPMNYLTIEATIDLFKTFNKENREDLRDMCIILLLYESGARVSELINIRLCDLKLQKPYTLILFGKGKKYRIVPIDGNVIKSIMNYIKIYQVKNDEYLFFNRQRKKLTREGVNYILQKHFTKAKSKNRSLYPDTLSPHCLRHSKAMHLLENGVNLIYIRDILGHSSVTTTEIYSKTNPEIKRKHLEEASLRLELSDEYSDDEKNELIDWLKSNI